MGREKVSFGIKLGYGVGDVGCNIFIVTTGLYLLYFLTNIIGVEPALAGLMLIFPKLWDVISDPIMGAISDITHSRWGRRRPYLLFSSIPFGFAFFFLFLTPNYLSEFANGLYVSIMFALGCTVFTVFNVPYSSMVAEMSDDYNERMSITSYRMIASSIGVLLAGGLAMPLVKIGGDGEDGFRFMGLVFGVLISLFCLMCFWGTRKAMTIPAKDSLPSVKEQMKIAFRNFPFKMLIMSYFFQSAAMGVLMAGLIYYVKYVMHLPEIAMGIIFPVFIGTAIVFIPVWVKIGKKIGKIKAYTYGLSFLALMLISFFFTGPTQLGIFYVQIFFLGIGFSSFQLFPFSMLPDTIEFDEMQSGMRREGIFSGIWSSLQKIAYALGPSIVGFTLSLSGFVKEGAQSESVELGIRVVFCLFTSFIIILSFLPFSKYNLTEEKFEEIKQRIRETR